MTPENDVTLGEVNRNLLALQNAMTTQMSALRGDIRDKADKSQFDRLEGRFDSLEKRTETIEEWRHDKEVAASIHRQRDEKFKLSVRAKVAIVAGALSLASSMAIAIATLMSLPKR